MGPKTILLIAISLQLVMSSNILAECTLGDDTTCQSTYSSSYVCGTVFKTTYTTNKKDAPSYSVATTNNCILSSQSGTPQLDTDSNPYTGYVTGNNINCGTNEDCTSNTALGSNYECRYFLSMVDLKYTMAQCVTTNASPYVLYNDEVFQTTAMPTDLIYAKCVNTLDCQQY